MKHLKLPGARGGKEKEASLSYFLSLQFCLSDSGRYRLFAVPGRKVSRTSYMVLPTTSSNIHKPNLQLERRKKKG